MRVVLDTNILVRANPRAGGSARALVAELARSPEHTLILSPFQARHSSYERRPALAATSG
jgi:predicted nucleic acid-binding protein